MSIQKETKLAEKTKRVKKKRLEKGGPLYIDPTLLKEGFRYRVVNDSPGEVRRRLRMGYEIVEDREMKVGDQNANTSSRLGNAVTLDVGVSKELKGVLMRIPEEDYQEILDELHDLTLDTEAAMFDEPTKDLTDKERNTLYGGIRKE